MTLTAVEMLFAFLIDFPLAALASMVICWVIDARRPADGALAGAFFLAVFIALIGICLLLGPVNSFVNVLALGEVFPSAIASASAALGQGTLALLLVMFVLFDLVLCTLGGLAGYFWAGALRARGASEARLRQGALRRSSPGPRQPRWPRKRDRS
jgi:hypothetical protein